MGEKHLHLILAGDVIESAGTRSYLREMIRHLGRAGMTLHAHIFQFRLSDEEQAGLFNIEDFDTPVFLAPGGTLFRRLPRPLYRLYERMVLLRWLRRVMSKVRSDDVVIGSGCLGALYVSGRRLPENAWWLKLGLIEEEGTGTLRYRIRKRIEAMHARRFRHRIVVSEPMGEFIAGEYGRPAGDQLILPCLVDLDRFPEPVGREALRVRMGLQDRFVVTYVGTAAPWQCAPETVAFFTLLRERMPNAFFWVFTPDKKRFESLLADVPAESWDIEFRPHHELASLLPAADIGCLVRRRERVNRVASPLKFPEYLSCGLPVLIGPEVGGYSRMVAEGQLGAVIDPDEPESWPTVIEAMLASSRDSDIHKRCRMEAEKLSWQSYAERLSGAFGIECRSPDM